MKKQINRDLKSKIKSKMKSKIKTSLIVLSVFMTLFLTGCGMHYSKGQAGKFIKDFLESKYDESFKVEKIIKKTDSSSFPYHSWYAYEAVSKDTKTEFEGRCDYYVSKDDSGNVCDYYEEAKFEYDIDRVLRNIETNAEGWELQELEARPTVDSAYMTTASVDSDAYLRDSEKIDIHGDIKITSYDPYEAFPSIYEYLKQLDDINDHTYIHIYTTDADVRSFIRLMDFDSFTYDEMVEKVVEDFNRR